MGKDVLFTKQDIKYLKRFVKKNPDIIAFVLGLSGIVLGYGKFGTFYYVIGATLLLFYAFWNVRKFYHRYLKEQKRQAAIIKHGLNNLNSMNGYEFEEFVARGLKTIGYKAETTSKSGDYGADIIAETKGKKIAIQVKHYTNKVEYKAVQQAHSGRGFYKCDEAWVITSYHDFTRQAKRGAEKLGVKLLSIGDYALLIEQRSVNQRVKRKRPQ